MTHIIPDAYTFDDLQITPKYSKVLSRSDCELTTNFTKDRRIRIPIVSSPMDTVTEYEMAFQLWKLGGIGFIHRFMTIEEQVDQIKKLREKIWNDYMERQMPRIGIDSTPQVGIGTQISDPELYASLQLVAVAIGVTGDYYERAQELFEHNVKTFLFDVAHGHHILLKRAVIKLREKFGDSITIVGGNIATANAAKDLIGWGVDVLRTGIGNGSLCETRIRTGVGIPQATAIADVVRVARKEGITIIADGGIRTPGDAAKAIGLGADMVMLGSLFAGTKETPGRLIRVGNFPNEQLFKQYRGSASQSAKLDRGENDTNIEGNSEIIPYKGKVKRIVDAITDGLKSSMSYVGAENFDEFRKNIEFVQITQAGQIEAKPHLLLK